MADPFDQPVAVQPGQIVGRQLHRPGDAEHPIIQARFLFVMLETSPQVQCHARATQLQRLARTLVPMTADTTCRGVTRFHGIRCLAAHQSRCQGEQDAEAQNPQPSCNRYHHGGGDPACRPGHYRRARRRDGSCQSRPRRRDCRRLGSPPSHRTSGCCGASQPPITRTINMPGLWGHVYFYFSSCAYDSSPESVSGLQGFINGDPGLYPRYVSNGCNWRAWIYSGVNRTGNNLCVNPRTADQYLHRNYIWFWISSNGTNC